MKISSSSSGVALFFITIAYDDSDPVLNHTKEWVEAFTKYFNDVRVYATHVGKHEVVDKRGLRVREIGGGSWLLRLKGLINLVFLAWEISLIRRRSVVLFHMTTKALAFLGPILRILRVPVYLWYSHQATPTSLRLSLPFINLVFSPTKESFPIQTEKLLPTGHGITVKATPYLESRVRVRDWSSIVVIGRIARVKRIEDLLIAVKSSSISDLKIELIGPIQDQEYKLWLQDLATELGIELQFLGSLNRKDLETTIRKKAIIYSGTCASVDKAPLEAAAMGCLVITNNVDLQILSGMSHFWMRAFCMDGAKISLEKQIQILTSSPVLEASISEAQSIALENNLESLVKELSAKITISRPPCLKK